jgi:polyhydroxybutyrate depolymerase
MRSIGRKSWVAGLLLLSLACTKDGGDGLLSLRISVDATRPPAAASKLVLTGTPGAISKTYVGPFEIKPESPVIFQFRGLPASKSPISFAVSTYSADGCQVGQNAQPIAAAIKAGAETGPIDVTLVAVAGCLDAGTFDSSITPVDGAIFGLDGAGGDGVLGSIDSKSDADAAPVGFDAQIDVSSGGGGWDGQPGSGGSGGSSGTEPVPSGGSGGNANGGSTATPSGGSGGNGTGGAVDGGAGNGGVIVGGGGAFGRGGVGAGGNAGRGGTTAGSGGLVGAGGSSAGTGGVVGTGGAGAGGLLGSGGSGTGGSGTGGSGTGGSGTGGSGTGGSGGRGSLGCGIASPMQSGTFATTIGGTSRQYIVDVPIPYDTNRPYRLVFVWHPVTGTATQVANTGYNGLKNLAANSAIFVAANGLNGSNGEASGTGWWNVNGVDMQFLQAMLDRINSNLCVDQDRIFSTGFSFGGMMSYTVGYEFNVFRAIAPCSGELQTIPHQNRYTNPLAFIGFHGDNDTFVLTAKGRAARDQYLVRNGCGSETLTVSPSPCVQYQGCVVPTIWCEFPGAHSTWSEEPAAIWTFFAQF